MISRSKFILRSLKYHWRINSAVAAAVVVTTAVLTGALVVGESMRESLRDLLLDRLGNIDHALVADHFFRDQLAHELVRAEGFENSFSSALPAILLKASAERISRQGGSDERSVARDVLV